MNTRGQIIWRVGRGHIAGRLNLVVYTVTNSHKPKKIWIAHKVQHRVKEI